MRVVIATVGIGGWYPRGVARLVNTIAEHCPGYEVQAWVNTLPFGAPASMIEDGYDYGPYAAKPFAMASAYASGADVVILCDAAFYAIKHIGPLVDHIAQRGYYLCDNGNLVGNWSSDRALRKLGVSRETAMEMREVSSYCVGLNFTDGRCVELLHRWCGWAGIPDVICGPHTNQGHQGRNAGWVSDDNRVKGHRHDQTVLSVLADRLGMVELSQRPKFTAYAGSETDETVLVNRGMGS